jgi:hypothetical protein
MLSRMHSGCPCYRSAIDRGQRLQSRPPMAAGQSSVVPGAAVDWLFWRQREGRDREALKRESPTFCCAACGPRASIVWTADAGPADAVGRPVRVWPTQLGRRALESGM